MSRELAILVTARNMASGVLKDVRGDIKGLQSEARRGAATAARNVGIIGVAAAGAVAVNVKAGLDSLAELERMQAQTNAVIESTQGIAGISAKSVRDLAEEYENLTTVDDKAIQNAENLLLTFTQVREKAFEPALAAILDMNAAMGGDENSLESVVIQVGKALNDPIKGVTALRRVGVQLTEQQEKQIKTLMEQNDLYGAQQIILDELGTQFGGSAAAQADTFQGKMKRVQDAVEGAQMALATAFLPVLEKVADKLGTFLADEKNLKAIEDFGAELADGLDAAVEIASNLPWDAIGTTFSLMGQGAKAVLQMFTSMPPWVQTAILTGWGLNKLTGGALGNIVGQLGSGLIKGVLGMNAGVVNINAGVVNGGGGGVPGVGGRGPGGFVGGLAGGLAVGAGVAAAGVAAVTVVNFEQMRNDQRTKLDGILDELPRTPEKIDRSIEAIEEQINMERPLLDGILFNTNVKPQLDAELSELKQVKAAQERGVAAARDAIPWAQRNVRETEGVKTRMSILTARAAEQKAAIHALNASEGARAASQHALLASIRDKKSSVTAVINTTVNVSLQEWQRRQISSIRAASNSGGFI